MSPEFSPNVCLNLYRPSAQSVCCSSVQEGLRKLFSRAGKVNRVFLNNPKTGQNLTFG